MIRRIGIRLALAACAVALLSGALAGCLDDGGASEPLSMKSNDGWRRDRVLNGGFDISVPDSFEWLNETKPDVEKVLASRPTMKPEIQRSIKRALDGEALRYIALEKSDGGDGYFDTVNLVIGPGSGIAIDDEGKKRVEDAMAQLMIDLDSIEVKELPAGKAIVYNGKMLVGKVRTITYGAIWIHNEDSYTLSVTGADKNKDALLKVANEIANRFKFLR